jgi:hypothetical protein
MGKIVIMMDRRFCHVNKAHLKGVKLDSTKFLLTGYTGLSG